MSLLSNLVDGWPLDEWIGILRKEADEGGTINHSRLVDALFRFVLMDEQEMPDPSMEQAIKATERSNRDLLPGLVTEEVDRKRILAALGSRCLGHVRDSANGTTKDGGAARRLCSLWRALRDRGRPDSRVDVWDRPRSLANKALSAEGEASALLAEIEAAAQGQCRVYFPTAGDAQVMVASVTRLELAGGGAGASTVRLAPWSVYTLDNSNYTLLEQVLTQLDLLRGKADEPGHFLLDISSASTDYSAPDQELLRPPMTLVVMGDSLSLPVCLAAWALEEKRTLRRMCITGKVDAEGNIHAVAIRDKLKALIKLFGDLNKPVMFLMPGNLDLDVYIAMAPENIIINGRRQHREISPTDLESLVNSKRPDVLTDCFDDYRRAILQWPVPAEESGTRTGTLSEESNTTRLKFVQDFDDDPAPFAASIARDLVERITREDERVGAPPGFAADCPTPFLLPLEKCDEEGKDFAGSLAPALEAGIEEWAGLGLAFSKDEFFQKLLKQVVLFESEKLWLIVYFGKSLSMTPYEEIKKTIDRLGAYLGKERIDHLVFVASDYHHYLMLNKHLKLDALAESAP